MPIGIQVAVDTSPIPASLSDLQSRTITLKAIRDGIKILNVAAKALAPRKLKHLYRAQGVKVAKGKRGKTISYGVQGAKTKYVKTRKTGRRAESALARVIPALYDHLVIGGTKPHSIRKGSKLARKGKADVGQDTGKKHPGARANPYRRRAYDAVALQVGKAILSRMGVEIQKMLAKNEAKAKSKLKF